MPASAPPCASRAAVAAQVQAPFSPTAQRLGEDDGGTFNGAVAFSPPKINSHGTVGLLAPPTFKAFNKATIESAETKAYL